MDIRYTSLVAFIFSVLKWVQYLNAIKYTLFKAQITKYPIYSCYILLHPFTSFYCNVMRIYAKFHGSNSDSSDSSRLEAPKIWWESSQWVTKNHMTNFVNHWNVSLIFIRTGGFEMMNQRIDNSLIHNHITSTNLTLFFWVKTGETIHLSSTVSSHEHQVAGAENPAGTGECAAQVPDAASWGGFSMAGRRGCKKTMGFYITWLWYHDYDGVYGIFLNNIILWEDNDDGGDDDDDTKNNGKHNDLSSGSH